jgi:hypothetical protein
MTVERFRKRPWRRKRFGTKAINFAVGAALHFRVPTRTI